MMLSPALFALLASISAAASTLEPPAAASHHLVWGEITLEISNNKPSTVSRRYMCTETALELSQSQRVYRERVSGSAWVHARRRM